MIKEDNIEIKAAKPEDADELLNIYSCYVSETAISFETEIPSVDEFRERIERTLKKYPYILAKKNGEILGYAYLSPFVGRSAYDWSAETTIYLKPDKKKMGLGRKLYEIIERIAREQNITNLYSCIGYAEKEDEYLNNNSLNFHKHMGYKLVGKFYNCGHKFDRWYSMVWMEKIINKHENAKEIVPFNKTNIYKDLL